MNGDSSVYWMAEETEGLIFPSQQRRWSALPLQEPTWSSKSGKMFIKGMNDNHLANTIRKVIRDNWRQNRLPDLMAEASKRGLDWKKFGRWEPEATILEVFDQIGD